MLLSTPCPRNHGVNIDLIIKTLYDKEYNRLTLMLGFFSSWGIAVLSALVTILGGVSDFREETILILIIIGLLCYVLFALVVVVFSVVWLQTERLKREYVDLVRIYFSTDKIVS